MRYVVKIGYREFVFDDASETMNFALSAKKSFMPTKYDDENVKIILLTEDEYNKMIEENKED